MHVVGARRRRRFFQTAPLVHRASCRKSSRLDPYENRRQWKEEIASSRRDGSEARVRMYFRLCEPNHAKYFGILSPAIGSAFPGRFSPSRRTDRRFGVQNSSCQAADLKFLLAHLAPSLSTLRARHPPPVHSRARTPRTRRSVKSRKDARERFEALDRSSNGHRDAASSGNRPVAPVASRSKHPACLLNV